MDGLECCHCGIEVIEPDADGQYWEGTCAICPECGCESHVIVDEGYDPPRASVSTDDDAIDVGQPQCDGSCGASRRWVDEGHRCQLNCDRVDAGVRDLVRARIRAGASESEIQDAVIAWGEGRPSDRDPRDDPREGDELLECAGSRRLLVDMVTGEHVYVRVTDGAGGLLSVVRVARGRWQVMCLGFEPAPP